MSDEDEEDGVLVADGVLVSLTCAVVVVDAPSAGSLPAAVAVAASLIAPMRRMSRRMDE